MWNNHCFCLFLDSILFIGQEIYTKFGFLSKIAFFKRGLPQISLCWASFWVDFLVLSGLRNTKIQHAKLFCSPFFLLFNQNLCLDQFFASENGAQALIGSSAAPFHRRNEKIASNRKNRLRKGWREQKMEGLSSSTEPADMSFAELKKTLRKFRENGTR